MRPVTRIAINAQRTAYRRPLAATRPRVPSTQLQSIRFNSSSAGGASNTAVVGSNYAVLSAIGALAIAGFFYIKPIRDVANKLNSALDAINDVKDKVGDAANQAVEKGTDVAQKAAKVAKQGAEAAGVESAGDLADVAKSALPGAATAILGGGSLSGLLTGLSDKDIVGTIDKLKAYSNDDVKKLLDHVQKAIKDADGKVENVKWGQLAKSLSNEFGKEYQGYIDMIVGSVPSTDDLEKYVKKIKDEHADQLKQLEAAAAKVYKSVEKAVKDGDDAGKAFVKGVQNATPEDVEKLVADLKKTAQEAGLPADQIESWLKDKAKDSAAYAQQLQDQFNKYIDYVPEPEVVVKQVTALSPALGKIVQELVNEAQDKVEDGKKALEKGKKEVEKGADKAKKTVEDKVEKGADKVEKGADKAKKAVEDKVKK
ncbi:hypothetical protein Q8F55_004555 [Vanrija albida]|uniref:Uncharacterized protein n=1 Tax=Vanrija albida TaxID=181172 RepID=A0ABR3Q7U7_9TREE